MQIGMRGVRLLTGMAATAATVTLLTSPTAGNAAPTEDEGPRTTITVATYNVCKVNCSGRYPWAQRRKAVLRTVEAARPAVLAVQEAPTLRWRRTTQWADLTRLLARAGYRQTSDRDGCTKGCTRGAHLYFDPERLRMFEVRAPSGMPAPPPKCMKYLQDPDLPHKKRGAYFDDWYTYNCQDHLGYTPYVDMSAGMVSQRALSGQAWGSVQDRNVSWAYLQDIATGGVFMALSLHLPNEKTAHAESLRRRIAASVARWIDEQNGRVGLDGIPVIAMGDLNSFQKRQPRGAQTVFYRSGFVDAFSAGRRINARYPTINVTPLTRRWNGFPPAPPKYAGVASRIDYILVKNAVRPLRYEVFLKLRKGRFDRRFRGSDHNLVRARLSLPIALR